MKKYLFALFLALAFFGGDVMAASVIDPIELGTAETNLIDTLKDIGSLLIAAGLVAVAFKWAKGALFG